MVEKIFCLLFAGVSMMLDLRSEKVSNKWIFAGVVFAIIWKLWTGGWKDGLFCFAGLLTTFVILSPLFAARMLGTGDIKVFMVLGGIVGAETGIRLIIGSFLIGGVEVLFVVLLRRNLKARICYFLSYLKAAFLTRTILPYLAPGKSPENIHFTVPMFICVLLYAGGLYE